MADNDDNDSHLIKKQPSDRHLEDLLRKMLPAGAPLPDEDQLDYSISVEYQPPTTQFHLVNHHSVSSIPVIKNSPFAKPPKFHHKYSTPTGKLTDSVVTPVSDTTEDEFSNVVCSEELELESVSSTSVTDPPVVAVGETKRNQKKSVCSRCGKGNRLIEKEKCIVCNARYCKNCLLKAMGSMPEGRKCVGCIGQPIDESRRQKLGKCSRMLSKVCSPLEVRQIMMAEKECSANQLRPEQVIVNGCQLKGEDLSKLLGCTVPPLKLKPGRYWYDKDSGLWGQEGGKPDRIVSSKLNVGGKLQTDASNGNTQVYINGRQITNVELRVLKLAKVQCPQGTHFWLYDDGSYEEEGQNNIKGNIWGKASTRFISSLLCLPVPCESFHGSNHDSAAFLSKSMPLNLENSRVQKLLLFGLAGSGTSTMFKQARYLYGEKFTAEEFQHLKLAIQSNTYRYLGVLLEGRERFEEEALMLAKESYVGNEECVQGDSKLDKRTQCVYSLNPKFIHFSDWILDIMAMGDFENYFPAAAREYAPLVDDIWKDPAIQETYKRKNELRYLPDVAKYFLDRVIDLSSNNYEPSEDDILYAEGITPSNGLSYLDFSINDQSPVSDENGRSSLVKYQLIRMSTKGEVYKWLHMFEDTRVVIYCIALSDYEVKNKMIENRDSFVSLVRHPCFADTPFLLILNKYDAFEDKIAHTPLTVCEWFHDFRPLKPHHNHVSLANQAYYYVAMKFKELYAGITGRKLFVWQSVARKRSSVEQGFKYIREVIRWDEEGVNGINVNGDDSFILENST